jgi:protoheme ferro-lyase
MGAINHTKFWSENLKGSVVKTYLKYSYMRKYSSMWTGSYLDQDRVQEWTLMNAETSIKELSVSKELTYLRPFHSHGQYWPNLLIF